MAGPSYEKLAQSANAGSAAPYPEAPDTLKLCLSAFDEQLARLVERNQAAARMADFIGGSIPEGKGPSGQTPVAVGFVSELRDRIRMLSALISELSDNQCRAESRTTG